MPVLQVPEVPLRRDGEGGGSNRLPQRPTRKAAIQAQVATGVAALPACLSHHRTREGPSRHQSRPRQPRLLTGKIRQIYRYPSR